VSGANSRDSLMHAWHSLCPSVQQHMRATWRCNMLKKLCAAALPMLLAALTASTARAATESIQNPNRKDFQVLKDVATNVERYTQFTIFDDVNASVKDGMVTLSGKVTMPYKKDDIEKRVSKIDGVRGVRDDITVLPVSSFDDQLRYRIARS